MWAEFSDLNDVLDEFGGGVRGVLGENLCGAYLQGSFAVGDAYEHSDVDVIVVTHEPLAGGDPAALQAVQARPEGADRPHLGRRPSRGDGGDAARALADRPDPWVQGARAG